MMRYKFTSDTVGDYKSRIGLILADDSMTDAQKKEAVNQIRLEAMQKYKFYSSSMKQIDEFTRAEQERLRWQKSRLQRQALKR